MSYYSIPLLAGVPCRLDIPGKLILIDSTGVASGVDVELIKKGTPQTKMPMRKFAFRLVADFDGVILTAPVNASVAFFLSFDDVQIGVSDGSAVSVPAGVAITNTVGNPVNVNFTGTVTPVLGSVTSILAATVNDRAQVAVTAARSVLVAVGATRRGLRIKNVGVNAVAIGGATLTYATAAVLIQAGETWNENEAPGAAWYCMCDVALASTLNIQDII